MFLDVCRHTPGPQYGAHTSPRTRTREVTWLAALPRAPTGVVWTDLQRPRGVAALLPRDLVPQVHEALSPIHFLFIE